MDLSPDVVPVQFDADVFLALPVCFEIVVRPDGVDEMLRVFLPDILYPEVVNYESELDWAPFMFPQSRYQLALIVVLIVALRVETLFQQLLGEDAGLG